MGATDDQVIWEYAKSHDMTIVSKDEDFQLMVDRQGSIPPQVVWVRLGDFRKAALLQAFATLLPDLRTLLDDGGSVIEIR